MTNALVLRLRRDPLLATLWRDLGQPRAMLVGGYIRDLLLGRPSRDVDLSLPGDADSIEPQARALADRLGTRAHLLGRPPRAIWRIESSQLKVELWPLGSLDCEADLLRRDFTCNAIGFLLPHGPLLDPSGGRDAIRHSTLEAVAVANLERDPVRLLRGARFLAHLPGFRLADQTRAAIARLAPCLARAPRERVGLELRALLDAIDPAAGLTALVELGLLAPAAPRDAISEPEWLVRHLAAVRWLADGGRPRVLPGLPPQVRAAARLALLLRSWGAPSSRACAPFGWDHALREHAAAAARLLDRARATAGRGSAQRREMIHDAGTAAPVVLATAAAVDIADGGDRRQWLRWWRLWRTRGQMLIEAPLLLDAAEVAALAGLDPGPELGRALAALRRAQVRGEVRAASSARSWLRRRISHHDKEIPRD